MSAEPPATLPGWPAQATQSWKLTLPCSRAEAESLTAADPELGLDPPPVLMTSEPDPAAPERWRLDVYFEGRPDAAAIAAVAALVPSATGIAAEPEPIEDADWVTLSQAWLEPIRAGRFHVHTAAHAGDVPDGAIAFRIEAGRAFGTGHHETTAGCLAMLDALERGGARFGEIVDVGTGTGLLAFAARALWPAARVTASDIDPVAIEVAAGNMAANAIPEGTIRLIAAAGMDDPALQERRYDLVVANILAGPLIELAPDLAAATAPGGSVMLAGLLAGQADAVTAAYREQGFRLADRHDRGDWPTLRMVREQP